MGIPIKFGDNQRHLKIIKTSRMLLYPYGIYMAPISTKNVVLLYS